MGCVVCAIGPRSGRRGYTGAKAAGATVPFVPYVIVHDVPATWEQYDQVVRPLLESTPEGLILHAAGKTDEGYRTVDVWVSEDAWARFRRELLANLGYDAGLARVEARFRDFSPEHLVMSSSRRR